MFLLMHSKLMKFYFCQSDEVLSKEHTCQVLRKSKSETARMPLIAHNLVIKRMEKSGVQVLRVRFFPLFKQRERETSNTVLSYPYHSLSTTLNVVSICKSTMPITYPVPLFGPGRIAQSVGHLTRKSGVLSLIPGLATYFRFSFRFFNKGSCQVTGESMCTKYWLTA